MVHLRLNEKESNPNPYINFISHLPCNGVGIPSAEDAKQLLKALAAQVKPVMKAHGMSVNSLEEYEVGRNWEAGETVELVLRRADGSFCATQHLLNTFCHELAHIKYMDHSRLFHKLWAQLNDEVHALQAKGYFGDGFWSSGTRLQDSSYARGDGISGSAEVLPEYLCGGAHRQKRSTYIRARRPRGPRKEVTPSLHTGAQTSKARKAGRRLNKELPGEGTKLSEEGGSKGKQANSKRAREERLAAIERRLKGGQDNNEAGTLGSATVSDEEDEQEDDDFRRLIMLDAISQEDLEELRLVPQESTNSKSMGKSLGKRPAVGQPKREDPKRLKTEKPASTSSSANRIDNYFEKPPPPTKLGDSWVCPVCTLINHSDYALGAACGTRP